MTFVQRALRLSLFTIWAVLMTALTFILGAAPLKVLRRRLGRPNYWATICAISALLFVVHFDTQGPAGVLEFKALAVAFFSLGLLLGVFDEFEEMGFNLMASAMFTLLINTLLSAGAFALWVYFTGPGWSQVLLTSIETTLKPVAELNPHLQINYFDLMLQLPSIAMILWCVAIYVAVYLEPRLAVGEMAPKVALPSLRPQLVSLRLPDFCVWIFIASLLGAFLDVGIRPVEALAVNALNVCVLLFFFQGLAVVVKYFESLRMSVFWQALFLILFVVQLFLFVSLLGFVDFWVDFRNRLAKRAEQIKRET